LKNTAYERPIICFFFYFSLLNKFYYITTRIITIWLFVYRNITI